MHSHMEEQKAERNYSQIILLNKIYDYLQLKNGSKIGMGYCSGLTAAWFDAMSRNKEKEFYAAIKEIVDCKDEDLLSIGSKIDAFLEKIELGQNPRKFFQRDIDKFFDLEKIFTHEEKKSYNLAKLRKLFNNYMNENVMMRISASNHAIGICRRGMYYRLYDSNYRTGEAKEFKLGNLAELFDELIFRLYPRCWSRDEVDILRDKLEIKLKIDLFRPPRPKSQRVMGLFHQKQLEKLSEHKFNLKVN